MDTPGTLPMRKKIITIQGGFPALSATFILDQMTGLIDRAVELENWSTYAVQEKDIHRKVSSYNLLEKTRYLQLPEEKLKFNTSAWVEAFLSLNRLPSLDEVSTFHVHYGANFNLLEPLFRAHDARVVVSFHGYDASRYIKQQGKNCYDYLFLRADLITTPSYVMRDRLIECGCPPDKVVVHRYGVDFAEFKAADRKFNTGSVRLLTVARLVEKKGLEYSIKAFADIDPALKAEYRIIGDGERRESLEALVEELGIQKQVKFLGSGDKSMVQKEMKDADIFVLNSVVSSDGDEEGVPVSLIEAQSMGLPVISSWHAGIPELVLHEKTGLLSEEKNVERIRFHMESLIGNPVLRKKVSTAAVQRVQEEFNIENLNDSLVSFLLPSFKTQPSAVIPAQNAGSPLQSRLNSAGWEQKAALYEKYFEYTKEPGSIAKPAISIVVVAWQYNDKILQNLQALKRQSETKFQLIFVDNGAQKGEFDSLLPYIHRYVRLNANTGAYLARNVGALFAEAPLLLFLDDDAIPADNLVASHIQQYSMFDVIAVRGIVAPASKDKPDNTADHYNLGFKPFPIYADIEGNTSYKSDPFFRVGGWDDEIIFGGGGVDLSIRLMQVEPDQRKQMYSPSPLIFHDYFKSAEHLENKLAKQKQSHERLKKKHPNWNQFLHSWGSFFGRADLLLEKGHAALRAKL